jgi:hypothetical protein
VSRIGPQAATLANVSGAATSTALFAANGAAKARAIYNDSSAVLYVKYGATASSTSYTVQIPAFGYFEFPHPVYAGAVEGIWASATGAARTTEVA